MKKVKNIAIIFVIILGFFLILPSPSKAAGLTSEQQNTIANFAKGFITKGNEKKILRYCQNNRMKGYNNQLSSNMTFNKVNAKFTNKMAFDCSSLVAFIYKETCGISSGAPTTGNYKDYMPGTNNMIKRVITSFNDDISLLHPGDILHKSGHVALYIGNGQIVEASTAGDYVNGVLVERAPDRQVKIANATGRDFTSVYRVVVNIDNVRGIENYTFPDGSNVDWDEEDLGGNDDDFEYGGVTDGQFDYVVYNLDWVINSLKELLDWIVGLLTYLVKAIVIGYTSIVEGLINQLISWTTSVDSSVTLEKLLFNKVPILDVNFFNMSTAGGEVFDQSSVIYMIRQNIAVWYYIIRYITMIGMLITLLYIGIKIATSTVAEKKAKYKSLMLNWFVSFIIVFGIHYFMVLILQINESFLNLMGSFAGGEESLYDVVRNEAYSIPFSVGVPATIMYIMMIIMLLKYIVVYVKRFLTVAILTFMAPIVGIGYAIDKIKDNKSQSLSTWGKEYVFNVIIQGVQALLYTVFVSMALNMSGRSIMTTILAFVIFGFMLQAEEIFRKIFNIQSKQLKDILGTPAKIFVTVKGFTAIARANTKVLGTAVSPVTKPIVNKSKQYMKSSRIDSIENSLRDAAKLGESEINIKGRGNKNYTYQVEELLQTIDNDEDYRNLAVNINEDIKNMDAENKKINKEATKETVGSIYGIGQMAVGVPMMFIDSGTGAALLGNGILSFKGGILKKKNRDKIKEKYGEKLKSDAQTNNRVISNTLRSKIKSQYDSLKRSNDIDSDKLAEVIEKSFTIIPSVAISGSLREYLNNLSNGSYDRSGTSGIEDLVGRISSRAKLNTPMDQEVLTKNIEKAIKKNISKQDGRDVDEITNKDIQEYLKTVNRNDLVKLVQKAGTDNKVFVSEKLVAQIDKVNMKNKFIDMSNKELEKNLHTRMQEKEFLDFKISDINTILDQLKNSGKLDFEINKTALNKNIINGIKQEMAKKLGVSENSITTSDINNYVAQMNKNDLEKIITDSGLKDNSIKGNDLQDKKVKQQELAKALKEILSDSEVLKTYTKQVEYIDMDINDVDSLIDNIIKDKKLDYRVDKVELKQQIENSMKNEIAFSTGQEIKDITAEDINKKIKEKTKQEFLDVYQNAVNNHDIVITKSMELLKNIELFKKNTKDVYKEVNVDDKTADNIIGAILENKNGKENK